MSNITRSRRLAIACSHDRSETRRVRRAIEQHCADRLEPDVVDDAKFVASELVANALEHGARDGIITVDVVVDGARAVVSVTSTGNSRDIPPPVDWQMPTTDDHDGRGLALTRVLSRCVELHTAVATDTGDWVSVTAHVGPQDESNVVSLVA